MKYILLLILFSLILLIPLTYAETTFFDNENDAFIMGNSPVDSRVTGEATGGEGCLTNWTCSDWNSCTAGVQIRNCTKTKTYCYADLNKKPIESQNCSGDKNNTDSEDGITNSPNENSGNINNPNSSNVKVIILGIFIVIFMGFIFLLIYKRYFVKTKKFLGWLLNKHEKYLSNSINGLINKEVYLESGHHIGKVNDIIIGETRIERLRIELDKKINFNKKGIIINYRNVKNVGEIIIIDELVFEHWKD